MGYDKDEVKRGKFALTLIDVGGGAGIRAIWTNYLAEVTMVV